MLCDKSFNFSLLNWERIFPADIKNIIRDSKVIMCKESGSLNSNIDNVNPYNRGIEADSVIFVIIVFL